MRIGSEIVSLSEGPQAPADLLEIVAGGAAALQHAQAAVGKARTRHAVDSVRYLVPITNPDKNIGLGHYRSSMNQRSGKDSSRAALEGETLTG